MSTLLQHLENNEAVLLMYMADELPAEDRAEVEQMLATDPSLRVSLEELRAARDAFEGAMGMADAAHAIAPAPPAVRRAAREMHQWQARRFAPPPPADPLPELRFPWWSYPLATAAAVLIAFVVWWGTQDSHPLAHESTWGGGGGGSGNAGGVGPGEDRYTEFEARLERRRHLGQLSWEFAGMVEPDGVSALEDVQAQLAAVATTEEDDPKYIFLGEDDEDDM